MLDQEQINFNFLLFQGMKSYEERNIPKSIKYFEQLLKKSDLNPQTRILLLGNLGVLFFYKLNHEKALLLMNEALEILRL